MINKPKKVNKAPLVLWIIFSISFISFKYYLSSYERLNFPEFFPNLLIIYLLGGLVGLSLAIFIITREKTMYNLSIISTIISIIYILFLSEGSATIFVNTRIWLFESIQWFIVFWILTWIANKLWINRVKKPISNNFSFI